MPGRIKVKMCGMRQAEDIEHAIALGVDALGFIFSPESSRQVSVELVKKLLTPAPLFVDIVAVFVNAEISLIRQVLQELPVQWLQFHGDESPEFCEQFNCPYIKAIPAVSTLAIEEAMRLYKGASAILLDTPSTAQRGGSGLSFDWQVIPKNTAKPIILAGGLNAITVKQALAVYQPYAVDLCSGLESSPGIKDHEKMTLFVQALGDQ